MKLTQTPSPDSYAVFHCGDTLSFELYTPLQTEGTGWIRTNIGREHVRMQEIIQYIENETPILSRDWYDIQMTPGANGTFTSTLPLTQVGRFEAKCFFLPDDSSEPIWPEGGNFTMKVEPAHTICANSIYNAFVRQFGSNISRPDESINHETAEALEKKGYSVIPASGTFRNLIGKLDSILGKMNFKFIQLLPIFPVPTTYGRMGRFGSPFAALDFYDVDPSYAELDKKTTPMDQFRELADAIHYRHGYLILDLPINHTGWGSKLQSKHPEWFSRGKDTSFESPGAWGVTWEDLSELDYSNKGLWIHMANVFLFWCQQGVDGFRCDAGYMIPIETWKYITAKVRSEYPETIFLLEGLGGKLSVTEDLLDKSNLDWAYSELFQNYTREQIEKYLPYAIATSEQKGLLVSFAETHDNNRLAATSPTYARMRTALCALCSTNGAFGIANGVEWLATEKINVHEAPSLNWDSTDNQIDMIARLNSIMSIHPSFHSSAVLNLVHTSHSNTIALKRNSADNSQSVVVLANLDHINAATVEWPANTADLSGASCDLLTSELIDLKIHGDKYYYELAQGEVLCLSNDTEILERITYSMTSETLSEASMLQALRSKALEIAVYLNRKSDHENLEPDELAEQLAYHPAEFIRSICKNSLLPVTDWTWPMDCKRDVLVPRGNLLFVASPESFRVKVSLNDKVIRNESSLSRRDGSFFTLITPPDEISEFPSKCKIEISVTNNGKMEHFQSNIFYLSDNKLPEIRTTYNRDDILNNDIFVLLTNGRGAMSQVRGIWGEIKSQYDAILAANLNPDYPVDRTVALTRLRAWLVCRGYSQSIDFDCLSSVSLNSTKSATWSFTVPTGQGLTTPLKITLNMHDMQNRVTITIERETTEDSANEQYAPTTIIIRPDIEFRNHHNKTKAYAGPESHWPKSLTHNNAGFTLSQTEEHSLTVETSQGNFHHELEWKYMIEHPIDAERGLGGHSDLFSPGYFHITLKPGEKAQLTASVNPELSAESDYESDNMMQSKTEQRHALEHQLRQAMKQFIVKRDQYKTVIAGYPWFLDWGRDTLICLRGIISAGLTDESKNILLQFACFEQDGTIPNMIHGKDASNRNTSDAPLWFFTACRDLHLDSDNILDLDANGRTIRSVLMSIAGNYIKGTHNGVKMDQASGLIFSPPHFTWMDTNHPACTPREGYPIEIQALWFAALRFLSEIDPDHPEWRQLAETVQRSIMTFYPVSLKTETNESSFLADCLDCSPGTAAKDAEPDRKLRPNQLLAITLGALKDRALCRSVIHSCEELLIPGAIRSLADQEYSTPYPYCGQYVGDEDTRRKPAYHNGTAWTWQFPLYSEALQLVYGDEASSTAKSVLLSSIELFNQGCIGQIPEITDGNSPHAQRGCGAQAWGITELYRVANFIRLFPPIKIDTSLL